MLKKVRKEFHIHGRVQGVGFRYFTYNMAEKLSINGWVINEYDGSVRVEGEGSVKDMAVFEDYLRKGPSFSEVTHVEVTYKNELSGYHSFQILY